MLSFHAREYKLLRIEQHIKATDSQLEHINTMTVNGDSSSACDVNTILNYGKALFSNSTSEQWFIDINASSDGKHSKNYEDDLVLTTIHDIRGHKLDTPIDVTGFQALHSPSTVDADRILNGIEEQIKEVYYREVEEPIKRSTGASHVVFFDHTVRKVRPGQLDDSSFNRQPVQRVHVDRTPIPAHTRVKRHVSNIQWKRSQLITVWRPLKNTVYGYSLAVADFRSIDAVNDLVPTTLVYPPRYPMEKLTLLFIIHSIDSTTGQRCLRTSFWC